MNENCIKANKCTVYMVEGKAKGLNSICLSIAVKIFCFFPSYNY